MNDSGILYLIVEIIILVGSYVVGRYIIPTVSYSETISDVTKKFNLIVEYADKFVSWAKYFMKSYTGSEKMDAVVNELVKITEKYDINISRTEIIAIAQKAYDNMMIGIDKAENAKKIADAAENKNEAKIVIPNNIVQTTPLADYKSNELTSTTAIPNINNQTKITSDDPMTAVYLAEHGESL